MNLILTLVATTLICCSSFSQIMANKAVVKISYPNLNYSQIDNKDILVSTFEEVLNDTGKEYFKQIENNFPGASQFTVEKIFPFLTTSDTVSISRNGTKVSIPPFWATFRVEVPKQINLYSFLVNLNSNTQLIDYANPDYIVQPASIPDDTLFYKQHSLNESMDSAHINVIEAWNYETGKPYIKVAIHDNGVDSLHPDIDVLFGGGYNGEDYPEDNWGKPGGHGTPVAGIIGARRNDITGIAGIAGGDTTESSGVSLIDTRYIFGTGLSSSYFMAGVVDAARSVGSYWDYPDYMNSGISEYYNQAPGFGVHAGNHSYYIKTDLPQAIMPDKAIPDENVMTVSDCSICWEAFLFSYLNGVVNVVARGNSGSITPSTNPLSVDTLFPQNLPDDMIILVGASGADGVTVQSGLNQSQQEANSDYWSLYGGNMDIIAPGSDSIVYSTNPNWADTVSYPYGKFNGTSAAAPHATGVAALLLSHYDTSCYSKRNLTIEDVEYILQKSATNLYGPGYDDTTGWGRLNAGEAIKMIDWPKYQIIHPDSLVQSEELTRDTIHLRLNKALTNGSWGPISSAVPLERQRNYQVIRVLWENTYSIAEYVDSTTTILDMWPDPSWSNSLKYYEDTSLVYVAPGGAIDTIIVFENFDLKPMVELFEFDTTNLLVKTRGYYYHFINKYDVQNSNAPHMDTLYVESAENYWYSIDPTNNVVMMPFSLYIFDSTLTAIYDFPCDSSNILYDQYWGLDEIEECSKFLVYPNPFDDYFVIDFNGLSGLKSIALYDLNGRIIKEADTNNDSYNLAVKGLSSGVYLLACGNNAVRRTYKLIKE